MDFLKSRKRCGKLKHKKTIKVNIWYYQRDFFNILNEVGMLKKYFYISVLLGTIVLSGCTDDEADNKEVTAESLTTEQSSAISNEVNTTKTVEVEPIPLNLTQEQKEEYYQKYVGVIEKVNAENNKDLELGLELEPITDFLDEYWIGVKDFEKLAKEIKFNCNKNGGIS